MHIRCFKLRDISASAPVIRNRCTMSLGYGNYTAPGGDDSSPNSKRRRVGDQDGLASRDCDEPDEIFPDGSRRWFRNGMLHRDGDLPAVSDTDGARSWYRNGIPHRDGDGPAVIHFNGTRLWYRNGVKHRDGDNPAVIRSDGNKEWHQSGVKHRHVGPAVVHASGRGTEWWRYGKRLYGGLQLRSLRQTCLDYVRDRPLQFEDKRLRRLPDDILVDTREQFDRPESWKLGGV